MSSPDQESGKLEWNPLGKHRYCTDADLLIIEYQGEINIDEVDQLIAIMCAQQQRYGQVLNITEVRSISVGPGARRRFVDAVRQHEIRMAAAVIGTNVLAQALASILFNAIRLLGGEPPTLGFFSSRAEARPWLDTQRSKLRRIPAK